MLTGLSKRGDMLQNFFSIFVEFWQSVQAKCSTFTQAISQNLGLSLFSQSCITFWVFKSVDQDGWQCGKK